MRYIPSYVVLSLTITFPFNLKSPINIVLKEILVEMNSLTFACLEKALLDLQFLMTTLPEKSIPSWNFFFFFLQPEYTVPLPSGLQNLCWKICQ